MSDSSKDSGVSKKKIYGAGTILALIMSVPAIIAFLLARTVTDNFYISIAISAIVLFIGWGFSLKISKKLAKM
jgi:ABC-type Mn2+/Zn2+ transport system permease subunit